MNQEKPPPLGQALQNAVEHHRNGRLQEAEQLYRQVLGAQPNNADALHFLGVIASQAGRPDAAVELIERAMRADAANPYFKQSLGVSYLGLGNLQSSRGQRQEAERSYRRAAELLPEDAAAQYNLANVLHERGELNEAERGYRRVIALQPNDAESMVNLGNVLQALGRADEAAQAVHKALALNPALPQAHASLASHAVQAGKLDEAVGHYERALSNHPGYAEAWSNLGVVRAALGQAEEAERAQRQAIALSPAYAAGHVNLAAVLKETGRLQEAEEHCRRALLLAPELAQAHNNLGAVLNEQGRPGEAVESLRRALELNPDSAETHSNLIMTLDLLEESGAAEQSEERSRWNARHLRRHLASIEPHANSREPDRRLRIGYVSGDFRRHSASYIFGPVLCGHDRQAFEVVCYSGVAREDEVTGKLRGAADLWRSTQGFSHEAVARQIREDRIDILVDLSGHATGNRLPVFALKPAPVQITAWGYATGTGLETMDCFLADSVLAPPSVRGEFAEAIADLPCCVCYEPPGYLPDVGPLPALSGAPFTFASMNGIEKLSDRALALWSRILAAVPKAQLLIKDQRLDDAKARSRLLARMGAAEIDTARILLRGASPHEEHLKVFNEIDCFLDSFPHGGGVSAMEALWMGVPVLALTCSTTVSRLSASILTAGGLTDWIARSDEEYVAKAVEAAGDLRCLAALRTGLRGQMSRSAVGDVASYTRAVEAAYRQAWKRWCER